MTEERNSPEQDEEEGIQMLDELTLLKDRARLMGLTFSNNIGLEALRKKVNDAMENGKNDDQSLTDPQPPVQPTQAAVNPLTLTSTPEAAAAAPAPAVVAEPPKPVVKMNLRQYLRQEQMKLVRVRITNMDPKKKDLPGEVITVANEYIGTVKKYVPFGEQSENGYHIPKVIYDLLESRRFLNVRVSKDPVTKQTRVDTSWAREFALEVLPPLTKQELHDLAIAQQAAGNS